MLRTWMNWQQHLINWTALKIAVTSYHAIQFCTKPYWADTTPPPHQSDQCLTTSSHSLNKTSATLSHSSGDARFVIRRNNIGVQLYVRCGHGQLRGTLASSSLQNILCPEKFFNIYYTSNKNLHPEQCIFLPPTLKPGYRPGHASVDYAPELLSAQMIQKVYSCPPTTGYELKRRLYTSWTRH